MQTPIGKRAGLADRISLEATSSKNIIPTYISNKVKLICSKAICPNSLFLLWPWVDGPYPKHMLILTERSARKFGVDSERLKELEEYFKHLTTVTYVNG